MEVQGTIHVIAQSHIDVAWLWRYDPETIHRCCKPTFTLATENMERFPDYTFSQSQVPLYEAMELIYPELFSRISRYIREGRCVQQGEVMRRGYELVFPWTLSSACEADLLEKEIGEVELEGDALKFPVGAYEIKTIKVKM